MNLRQATPEDVPAIAKVFIETRTRCLPFIVWDYSQNVMEDVFTHQMAHMEMWLAELDGAVVGYVAFIPGEVEHLYLLPEFHGKGIGKAMLGKALENQQGEVQLWVFQENRQARAFYERNGFHMEYETDGQENMEKTPDARYVCQL